VVVVGVDFVDGVVGAGLVEGPAAVARAAAVGVLLELGPVAEGVEGPGGANGCLYGTPSQ